MTKWIEHVKAYAKKHKCSYKEALQRAKHTYGGMIKGSLAQRAFNSLSQPELRQYNQAVEEGEVPRHNMMEHFVRKHHKRQRANIREHKYGPLLQEINQQRQDLLSEARDFVRYPVQEQINLIQQNPDLHIVLMIKDFYRITGHPIPYELLQLHPEIGQGIRKNP
jgi:hypothetical protein